MEAYLLYISHIFVFLILVLCQAFFINGISVAASGSTEILPDGTEKDSENILYPVRKWLYRHDMVKVYYTHKRLEELYNKIISALSPMHLGSGRVGIRKISFFKQDERAEIFHMATVKIESMFGVKIERHVGEENIDYRIFIEEKKYKLSKYLRLSTLGCIKCMPSIWGSITYWVAVNSFLFFLPNKWLFWILDIVMLIPISYFINKKIER